VYLTFLLPMFAYFDYQHGELNLLEMRLRSYDYHNQANDWFVIIDDSVRVILWLYSIYCAIALLKLYCKKANFDVT
jgi:hypothetical protein